MLFMHLMQKNRELKGGEQKEWPKFTEGMAPSPRDDKGEKLF
jgi:hypothetical protein